jgi:hypothetical protein
MASISKQWLDKMGGSAAHRLIGSGTRDGEADWECWTELEKRFKKNSRTIFI